MEELGDGKPLREASGESGTGVEADRERDEEDEVEGRWLVASDPNDFLRGGIALLSCRPLGRSNVSLSGVEKRVLR